MSVFNVFTVSMCQVEELGAKDLMVLFKPFRHDPSELYERVNSFAKRLQLDESEISFFISELKSRYKFYEGTLAYSIAFALSDYAEFVYRKKKIYEKREDNFFPNNREFSF